MYALLHFRNVLCSEMHVLLHHQKNEKIITIYKLQVCSVKYFGLNSSEIPPVKIHTFAVEGQVEREREKRRDEIPLK